MALKAITLKDWLLTISILSEPSRIVVKYPLMEGVEFERVRDIAAKAPPGMLAAPVMDALIESDGALTITVKPKQYSTRRP